MTSLAVNRLIGRPVSGNLLSKRKLPICPCLPEGKSLALFSAQRKLPVIRNPIGLAFSNEAATLAAREAIGAFPGGFEPTGEVFSTPSGDSLCDKIGGINDQLTVVKHFEKVQEYTTPLLSFAWFPGSSFRENNDASVRNRSTVIRFLVLCCC